MMKPMPQLEADRVVQRYGKHTVVNGVGFSVAAGTIGCLLGPSGCGKTTVLRCIAGFEEIAEGEIRLNGEVVSRPGWRLSAGSAAHRHGVPGLRAVPAPDDTRQRRRSACAASRPRRARNGWRTCCGWWACPSQSQKYPHELSGGQQQRVALARALAPQSRAGAAGRAVLQPRRRPARAALARGARHPESVRHDGRAGDPRPARGVCHGRRDRRHGARAGSSNGIPPTTSTTGRRTGSSPTSSARACSSPGEVLNRRQVQVELGRSRQHRGGRLPRARLCPVRQELPRRGAAAARRRRARRRQPGAGGSAAQGVSRRRDPLHAGAAVRACASSRWCRRTTTTRSVSGSASAWMSTTSSLSGRKAPRTRLAWRHER